MTLRWPMRREHVAGGSSFRGPGGSRGRRRSGHTGAAGGQQPAQPRCRTNAPRHGPAPACSVTRLPSKTAFSPLQLSNSKLYVKNLECFISSYPNYLSFICFTNSLQEYDKFPIHQINLQIFVLSFIQFFFF